MKNKDLKVLVVTLSLVVVLITGCDPTKKWEKQEQEQIQDYLGSLVDTVFTKEPSGLYYYEMVPGTGAMPVTTIPFGLSTKECSFHIRFSARTTPILPDFHGSSVRVQ